jgi:hypothetical protein
MITCASGSASTSGQPTICSAHPQSQTSVSSSCRVAVSPASSSAQAGSEQTSVAVYMTGQSVGARSDGMQDGYHRTVLAFPVLRFSLPAGGGASVVSGVIIALGGILIAVGLAAAAFLTVVL